MMICTHVTDRHEIHGNTFVRFDSAQVVHGQLRWTTITFCSLTILLVPLLCLQTIIMMIVSLGTPNIRNMMTIQPSQLKQPYASTHIVPL